MTLSTPADTYWDECPLVGRDPEMVHGAPVIRDEKGNLTRLPADDIVSNVEAYMEMDGLSEEAAIDATLAEVYPDTPGGKETIRALLAYQATHSPQLQP